MRLGGELEAGILEWEFFENGSFYFSFFPALNLTKMGVRLNGVFVREKEVVVEEINSHLVGTGLYLSRTMLVHSTV